MAGQYTPTSTYAPSRASGNWSQIFSDMQKSFDPRQYQQNPAYQQLGQAPQNALNTFQQAGQPAYQFALQGMQSKDPTGLGAIAQQVSPTALFGQMDQGVQGAMSTGRRMAMDQRGGMNPLSSGRGANYAQQQNQVQGMLQRSANMGQAQNIYAERGQQAAQANAQYRAGMQAAAQQYAGTAGQFAGQQDYLQMQGMQQQASLGFEGQSQASQEFMQLIMSMPNHIRQQFLKGMGLAQQ